jgi:nucleotide-binding universal stress UspA family protein
MLPIRTILHPTDFSEYSDYAFRLACALARDYGARLVVLHVTTPLTVVYSDGIIPPEPVPCRDEAREKLDQMQAADADVRTEHMLADGDAATEILRVAASAKADVILMGTHGRTGLGRLLMGSVAENVLRKAPCPVVTVKSPLAQAASTKGSLVAAGATSW